MNQSIQDIVDQNNKEDQIAAARTSKYIIVGMLAAVMLSGIAAVAYLAANPVYLWSQNEPVPTHSVGDTGEANMLEVSLQNVYEVDETATEVTIKVKNTTEGPMWFDPEKHVELVTESGLERPVGEVAEQFISDIPAGETAVGQVRFDTMESGVLSVRVSPIVNEKVQFHVN